MRCRSALRRAALLLVAFISFAPSVFAQTAAVPAAAGSEPGAKTWIGREKEFEDYIKTAEIVSIKDIPIGVTKPQKAILKPGGPVEAIAWKYIPPKRYQGYWESYKSEIAAYELDKLLGLGMVPPTVEKRHKGELGAAIMWCPETKSFKDTGGVPKNIPPQQLLRWNKQIIRTKMFDNLIYNMDPNLGNWLVDPAWNLILIDHTRSFTTDKKMAHEDMGRIDVELWEKMQALTEESLNAALGEWIGKREVKAMIERRDKMRDIIAKLVKDKGEAVVFVK
ncbi:MAG: hypothetical protein ACRD1S_03055 [Vicinamibacterales bacterium]